jgi:hypothetical protein
VIEWQCGRSVHTSRFRTPPGDNPAVRERAAGRPVFTVDGETFSWADVVAATRVRGDWERLEQTTRDGLACSRRLAAEGEELDWQQVAEAEARFRYARNLLAGEEMEAWLGRWTLKASEWRAYVRRALLRERWVHELDETAARFSATAEEVGGALWAEAVCSGFLEDAARRLAGDLALAAEAGEAPAGDRHALFARTKGAAQRAGADAATEDALEHEVAVCGLEWLRVEGQLLELPGEDLASEVALCIREDGRALAEVASECGVEPRPLRVYMEDVEGELSARLIAAREGELVGPLRRNERFVLLLVQRKVPPVAADPDVHRRAEERVVARAVERAIAANVTWHERL